MTTPIVSVVMATYNHAPYVSEAIASVLQQRNVDFEFLIADDGSTDSTPQIVKSANDDRIHFYAHRINRGACIVLNELISQSSGKYIALINSDDRWITPDKLAFQLDFMTANPKIGACFGKTRFIDKKGKVLKRDRLLFSSVFDQDNRTQGAWLRYFFDRGNCLCHPSILIRRKCFDELGEYNNNFRQLPDLDMWIRLVKRFQIHIVDRELVEFRVLPKKSASCQTIKNSVRIMNEHYLIAENFFDNVNSEQLIEGFADKLKFPDLPSKAHLDIEKALLLLLPHQSLGRAYNLIGLLKLNRLLVSEFHKTVLSEDYGIDGRWMHESMAGIDVLRPLHKAVMSQIKSQLLLIRKYFMH